MSIDSPLSDTNYYSPENSDNEDIIDCKCNNLNDSCLILCFNSNTNQFESIDCKIFKKQFIILNN
jgi:hypothetical protein